MSVLTDPNITTHICMNAINTTLEQNIKTTIATHFYPIMVRVNSNPRAQNTMKQVGVIFSAIHNSDNRKIIKKYLQHTASNDNTVLQILNRYVPEFVNIMSQLPQSLQREIVQYAKLYLSHYKTELTRYNKAHRASGFIEVRVIEGSNEDKKVLNSKTPFDFYNDI